MSRRSKRRKRVENRRIAENSKPTLSTSDQHPDGAEETAEEKKSQDNPQIQSGVHGKKWHPLLRSGWVQNVIVTFVFACITPVVGIAVKNPKVIIFGAAAGLTLVIWVVAFLVVPSETKDKGSAKAPDASTPIPITNVVELRVPPSASQDFIPGTTFTHTDVEANFPFGYVIFSEQGGLWTRTPRPSNRLHWHADWDKVVITPNYSENTVFWKIPKIDYDNVPGAVNSKFDGNEVSTTIPLAVGKIARLPIAIFMKNQPLGYIATLSDRQGSSVFVLGFRIPGPNEPLPPVSTPYRSPTMDRIERERMSNAAAAAAGGNVNIKAGDGGPNGGKGGDVNIRAGDGK